MPVKMPETTNLPNSQFTQAILPHYTQVLKWVISWWNLCISGNSWLIWKRW